MQNQPWGPPNPYAQPAANNPYAQQQPAIGPIGYYRQNLFVPYGVTAGPLVGPGLRRTKLATGIVQIVLMVIGMVVFLFGATMRGDGGDVFFAVGGGILALWYLVFLAYGIVSLIWLYKFWAWIPPDQRHTTMWKKYISPAMAVGLMFIPYFNIYWMFVVYLGIAEILERLRTSYPTSRGPVKTLAILTLVIPMVFFPAGPILQYLFAKHVEEMANEMQGRMMSAPMPVT